MKIIKKINFITLLIITILSMNLSMVKATSSYSAKLNLTLNSSNITVGDEISITLNISSINGFNGIHLIAAKKVYDSNTFEYIGCYPQNGWELKGDSTNILLHRNSGDVKTGAICTLKFKVLKFINNSTITLSNIDATGNNGDVYFEDTNVNSPSVNIKMTEKVEHPTISEEKVTTSRGSSDSLERKEVSDTAKVTDTTEVTATEEVPATKKAEVQVSTATSNKSENKTNNNVANNSLDLTTTNTNSDVSVVNEVTNTVSNTITEDVNNNSITNTDISPTVETTSNNNIVTTVITILLLGSTISVIVYYFIKK